MSKVEDEVCKKIQGRAEQVRKKKPCVKCGHSELKYDNKTMERSDLSLIEWLIHAQEEAMDLSVYLQKLIELEGEEERHHCVVPLDQQEAKE